MKTRSNAPRPFVWKNGYVSWAVTTFHYCQELDQMMYTTRLLRTWGEAMQFAQKEQR